MPAGRVTSVDTLVPTEIRAALERVLVSGDFDASERNHAFLRYVVEETLASRAHLIKGYSIAQSVFKRSPDFDPQLDPVVRIEASRLRRSLERYYLKAGRNDQIRIDLPKGGYVPTFESVDPETDVPLEAAADELADGVDAGRSEPAPPSVAIVPFRNLDGDPKYELFALGITEELFTALTRFGNLRVVAANTSLKLSPLGDPVPLGRGMPVSFALQGSVRTVFGRVRVTVQLLNVEDGLCIWATSLDRPLNAEATIEGETEIAGTIAATVGAPYGVIGRYAARQLKRGTTPGLVMYERVLRSYMYRRNPTQELHDEVRGYLEKSLEAAPDHAENWAQLAYVYINEYRFDFSGVPDRGSLRDLAGAAAERAVALDERSAFGHLALSLVQFYQHELGRAAREGQRALELGPGNSEIMTQVGWRLAIPGQWEEGMRLFQRGLDLDPDPPKWHSLILALDAYRRGDGPVSLNEIRTVLTLPLPIGYIIGAAILLDLDQTEEAYAAAASGRLLLPSLFNDPAARLRLHNLDPRLAERLMHSLRRSDLAPTG